MVEVTTDSMLEDVSALIVKLLPFIDATDFEAWFLAQYWVKDKAKAKEALKYLPDLIKSAKRSQ